MLVSNRDTLTALLATVVMAALLSGCCSTPWGKFPMPARPDRSCRTGSASGYDVFLWACQNNQHIAIYKYTAEMSCSEPQKEVVACGQLSSIELQLGQAVAEGCDPPPDAFRWP
jgi:hypothetical protein